MATCKTIPLPPPPQAYELTLSAREADVLVAISAHVGGMPSGYRGDVDRISRALRDAGVPSWDGSEVYEASSGGITF